MKKKPEVVVEAVEVEPVKVKDKPKKMKPVVEQFKATKAKARALKNSKSDRY